MKGFEFIEPLVADMYHADPTKRPSMSEVVKRYDKLYRSLTWYKLRSRLVPIDEGRFGFIRIIRTLHHFFRTLTHIVLRRNAIPTPKP